MDAVDARAGEARELRAHVHRLVDAHLAYHEAYGSDPARLLADSPEFAALAVWAGRHGVPVSSLREDVARLFLPVGGPAPENGGSPPPDA